MEEYHQVTLTEWMEAQEALNKELNNIRKSYVKVGYILRTIEDKKMYLESGYKSTAEFAQKVHGLHPSTTSRLIAINKEFSVDGYSPILDDKYTDMNKGQLIEMLSLSPEDREMIRPGTKVEDIREVNRLNKESAGSGGLERITLLFFESFPELLREMRAIWRFRDPSEADMIELIAPSGSRSFRKDGMMLMMYEDSIKFKAAGKSPEPVTWSEFLEIAKAIPEEQKEEVEEIGENDTDRGTERNADECGREGRGDDQGDDPGDDGADQGSIREDSRESRGDNKDMAAGDSSGAEPDAVPEHESADNADDDENAGSEDDEDEENGDDDGEQSETGGNEKDYDDATEESEAEGPEAAAAGMNPPSSPENVENEEIATSQFSAEIQEKTASGSDEIIVDESGNPAPEALTEREYLVMEHKAIKHCDEIAVKIAACDWKAAIRKAEGLLEILNKLQMTEDMPD